MENVDMRIPLDDEHFLDDDQLQFHLTSNRHTRNKGNTQESGMSHGQKQNECCSNLQYENRCESIECHTERTELLSTNQDLKARLKVAEEKARHFTEIIAALSKDLQHSQTKVQMYQNMLSGYDKEKAHLQYTNKDLRVKLKITEEKANKYRATIQSVERSSHTKNVALSNLNKELQRLKADLDTSVNVSWEPQHSSTSNTFVSKEAESTTNDFIKHERWKIHEAEIQKPKKELTDKEARFKELVGNCTDGGCQDFMQAYFTAINSDSQSRQRKLISFYPTIMSEMSIEDNKYQGRESILDAWQKFWSQDYETVMRSFENKRQDNGRTLIIAIFDFYFCYSQLFDNSEYCAMAAELIQLTAGMKVERWTIDKKLGEGGFGAVYLCSDPTGKYALKTEGANEQIQVLKMEVFVLTELTKRASKHFCRIEDKGRFGNFNYVVMTLVGKSLQDLRKETPQQHFTMGTAIGCGIQTLEALEDLHGIGYLHRDIKPGNYTIGRAELNELRKVYILDFGMARKFTNEQGVIRRPRQAAGFRGTVRYAPISCHLQRELCRKDDVETWVYMCVELTTGNLPWKNVQDMNQVGEYKKRVREPQFKAEMFNGCPREYDEILTYVDSLKYYDKPDYQRIYNTMRRAFTSMGAQEFPYDWEKPAAPAGGYF